MQLFKEPLSAKPVPSPAPEPAPAPRKKKFLKLKKSDGSRRFALIAIAIGAVIIGAATMRSHYVLAAKAPGDMPGNSLWVFTGRDANTNVKQGLWAACWLTPTETSDHCRITDQGGATQFDGDMLPLKAGQAAVADKDLQIVAIDPSRLWIAGVDSNLPVPLLALTNGVQLVPVWAREGLQKRLARGEWQKGLRPVFRGIAVQ